MYTLITTLLCILTVLGDSCKSGEILIEINRIYAAEAKDEIVEFWKGDSEEGILKSRLYGLNNDNRNITEFKCFEMGRYTLVLKALSKSQWNIGSYISIYGADRELLVFARLENRASAVYYVDFHWLISSTSSISYSDSYSSLWNSIGFDDSYWNVSRYNEFPIIPTKTITRYYRVKLLISSAFSVFSSIRLGFNSKYGIIAYINGDEKIRHNMKEGAVYPYTPPTESDGDFYLKQYIVPYEYDGDSVVIGFEVHSYLTHANYEDLFYSISYFVTENERGSDLSQDLIGTSDSMETSTNRIHNLFDKDRSTSFMINGEHHYVIITKNGYKYDIVNAYVIELSKEEMNIPTKWNFEGSNDNYRWEELDMEEGTTFFQRDKREHIVLDLHKKHYLYYRFSFMAFQQGSSSSLSIASISLFYQPHSVSSAYLAYPEQQLVLLPLQSVHYLPVMNGFSQFVISTTHQLPVGLSFRASNGLIEGQVSSENADGYYAFTITAILRETTSMYSTTLVIVISSQCRNDFAHLVVTMNSHGDNSRDRWGIVSLATQKEVYSANGMESTTGSSTSTSLCLGKGMYQFVLSSSLYHLHSQYAFSSFFHLSIELSSSLVYSIGDVTLSSEKSLTVPLSLYMLCDATHESWMYRSTEGVPMDWYSVNFGEAWPSIPTPLQLSRNVWLFRYVFSLTSDAFVSVLDMHVFSTAGLVVYCNGKEIYRSNVNDNPITASSTATKATSAYWHVFTTTYADSSIHIGRNVFAIAVVNVNNSPRSVDFQVIAYLLSSSSMVSRISRSNTFYDSVTVSDSSHNAGDESANLYDSDIISKWSSNQLLPQYTQYIYVNDHKEIMNTYCITASLSHISHIPTSWAIEGFVAATSSYQVIDTKSGIHLHPGKSICMKMNSLSSYSGYRYRVNAVNTQGAGLMLAELSFLYIDYTLHTVPSLSISATSITTYLNCEYQYDYSINNAYYQSFSVSPALPQGLFIDSRTGYLFGTPTVESVYQQYTLEGIGDDSSRSSVVISLAVVDCDELRNTHTSLAITISGYYRAANPANSIYLYVNDVSQSIINSVVVNTEAQYNDVHNQQFEKHFCLPAKYYRLHLVYYLASSSTVSLSATINSRQITVVLDPSSSSYEYEFDTQRLINSQTSRWYYYINSNPPRSDWFSSSASSEWYSAPIGSFPYLSTIASYYCTTFYAKYASYVSGLTIAVRTRSGFIVYLNGVEMTRIRMPEGPVSATTLPTYEGEEDVFVIYSGGIQYQNLVVTNRTLDGAFHDGDNNRFCVEVHRTTTAEENNPFSAYIEYVGDDVNRVQDGDPWGSVEGGVAWGETIEKAFDGNIETKYFGESDCVNVAAMYTYHNERREFMNVLRFYAGNNGNRDAKRILFQGSVDLHFWDTLLEDNEMGLKGSGWGRFKEWNITNKISYRAYRVILNGCAGEGIEVGEILLKSRRVQMACEGEGDYPPADEGEESRGPCKPFFDGYSSRYCLNGKLSPADYSNCYPWKPTSFLYSPDTVTIFTTHRLVMKPTMSFYASYFSILPRLVTGLSLNTTSGEITGVPEFAEDTTIYTITAGNNRGKTTTVVSITVVNGCSDIGDFPETIVGESGRYRCAESIWYYGIVTRKCEMKEGVPTWSRPEGTCKSLVGAFVVVCSIAVIVIVFMSIWCVSESVNRRANVYELPNGEYEMHEKLRDFIGSGDQQEEAEAEAPIRMRPKMKLVGRPVFIYIPRYFHKSRQSYHKMKTKL